MCSETTVLPARSITSTIPFAGCSIRSVVPASLATGVSTAWDSIPTGANVTRNRWISSPGTAWKGYTGFDFQILVSVFMEIDQCDRARNICDLIRPEYKFSIF